MRGFGKPWLSSSCSELICLVRYWANPRVLVLLLSPTGTRQTKIWLFALYTTCSCQSCLCHQAVSLGTGHRTVAFFSWEGLEESHDSILPGHDLKSPVGWLTVCTPGSAPGQTLSAKYGSVFCWLLDVWETKVTTWCHHLLLVAGSLLSMSLEIKQKLNTMCCVCVWRSVLSHCWVYLAGAGVRSVHWLPNCQPVVIQWMSYSVVKVLALLVCVLPGLTWTSSSTLAPLVYDWFAHTSVMSIHRLALVSCRITLVC